jgi:Xaa-Pro aminopeptidase
MEGTGVDVLVLCGQANISFATGARVPACDQARASAWRSVAVLTAGEDRPVLYTAFPEGAPDDVDVRPFVAVESESAAAAFVAGLPTGRLALDDAPFPLWTAVAAREPQDAAVVLAGAKITKTADELECIRQAQAINEEAMRSVRPVAQPGARTTDLSGAFLRAIAELGATANTVDPVFQITPPSAPGEPQFPTVTEPFALRDGDVVWVDTGINRHGYASDFGATWHIGHAPDAQQRDQFARWRDVVDRVLEVVRPGATGADLVAAGSNADGTRPWLSYFYLAHGIGTDSAEMPLVGTDRGDEFDASIVLAPGMVLVMEPVIWDNGHGGHRSEEIVAVTDDGYCWLSERAVLDDAGG